MPTRIQVIFYSMYGHIHKMAEAVAEGARTVDGTEVELLQIQETMSQEVLTKMGAVDAKKSFAHVPLANPAHLVDADAVILGTPTRFGNYPAQVGAFLDYTGGHWANGALVGKVASVFTSTASQHGGQESTCLHAHTFFFHQGMIVVGVPYECQELLNLSEISGGTPYGASTIAGPRGERQPTKNELAIARFQGRHVTRIASRLAAR
jgi:NAD(P)H dehydrogenase (quinone)